MCGCVVLALPPSNCSHASTRRRPKQIIDLFCRRHAFSDGIVRVFFFSRKLSKLWGVFMDSSSTAHNAARRTAKVRHDSYINIALDELGSLSFAPLFVVKRCDVNEIISFSEQCWEIARGLKTIALCMHVRGKICRFPASCAEAPRQHTTGMAAGERAWSRTRWGKTAWSGRCSFYGTQNLRMS